VELTEPPSEGATPLTAEQLKGLKNPFITTHAELNSAEQANILRARTWARSARSATIPKMLSRDFLELLHSRMYGDVWSWAGKQRLIDTNIGVGFTKIGIDLRMLFDDAKYWVENKTFSPLEFAVRMHHRIVFIHPFPNGNGRLSRFYADLLLTRHFKQSALSWGGGLLGTTDPGRQRYIEALRAADGNDYQALIVFALGDAL
jgi:Fic-DOC domain mobile mystery protein B